MDAEPTTPPAPPAPPAPVVVNCAYCKGSGKNPGLRLPSPCPTCKGAGKVVLA